MTPGRVACIIPTRNAGERFAKLMASLRGQTMRCEIFVVDSSSSDDTVKVARDHGATVDVIPPGEFSHGGTRQMMVDRYPHEFYVFLTQDALPSDALAVGQLMAPFQDERVGAVCGRQIAHESSSPLADHARRFSYPDLSRVVDLADAARLGINAGIMSNAFSAYRGAALADVGGFPQHVIVAEDRYVAAKMLVENWKIAYAGDAICRHSHDYTLWEECQRYFDMGVFLSREKWISNRLGTVGGEGLRYALSELRFLGARRLWLWPASLVRNAMKLLGLELGKREATLPSWLKKRFSMQPGFWLAKASESSQPERAATSSLE